MIHALVFVLVSAVSSGDEPAWSTAAVVRHRSQRVVRIQARIDGDYLFVRAVHEKDWHTYAMDNQARSAEALQGKQSLGIEEGVEIKVKSGLILDDRWSQTRPHDLSKPKLRWYTYGFDQTAVFACRIKRVTAAPIIIQIQGQACSGESCQHIDVVLELEDRSIVDHPSTTEQAARLKTMLKGLVPVWKPPPALADELQQ